VLYVAYICPWACRTLIARRLKGLEDAVGVSYAAPYRDERGWAFPGGPYVDDLHGWEYLRTGYEATDPDFGGRVSVPVLWDKHEGRIVSNESQDIVRMLSGDFNKVVIEDELAVRLARRAVGGSCFLLGDIGPFGDFLEPAGTTTEQELLEIFRTQAMSLKRGGADAIIIETMSDPGEMRAAIRAAKDVSYWPVFATYAFNAPADGAFRTMMGTTAAEAIQVAIEAGADAVGANCGTSLGLADYVELAKVLVKAAGRTPVILQPNAGSPQTIQGRTVHTATPQDMADLVRPLLDAGVRIIGGCCGTTPAHLKAMAGRLRA
jgi:5-methyltetrahydrofolate--homocysteine methyltransferase